MPQAAVKGRLFSLSFFSSFYGFVILRAKIGKFMNRQNPLKPLEAFCPYLFWKICFYDIGYQLFVKFCHKILSIRFLGCRWEKNEKGQPFSRPAFCSFPLILWLVGLSHRGSRILRLPSGCRNATALQHGPQCDSPTTWAAMRQPYSVHGWITSSHPFRRPWA